MTNLRVIALSGLLAGAARGDGSFRLHGDRLTLRVEDRPLSSVLSDFAAAGVRVRMDPRADRPVSAAFENEDAHAALVRLIEPLGYALVWERLEGPLEPIPHLAEIRVFLPGEPAPLTSLSGSAVRLDAVEGPIPGEPGFVRDELLISFRAGARRDEVERLLAQLGGMAIGSVPEMGLYRIRLPAGTNIPALAGQLARHPLVSAVEPNYVFEAPRPARGEAAGRALRRDPPPPEPGAALVAVLDSGLRTGAGLEALVRGRYDALDPARLPGDSLGHGTQMAQVVAGLVAPDGADTGRTEGGLPLLAVRAFDDAGRASSFGLFRGIAYAAGQGARVINLSWGTETHSGFLAAAVAYAQAQGMVVVASAGNAPTGKPVYPAAYPGVVAVSALGADQTPWASSNYGDFVMLSAPGTATFPAEDGGAAGAYAGTSIAGAYVSRAIGLYFSKHPEAGAPQAVAALREAVAGGHASARDPLHGHGRLDAEAMGRLLR